MDEDGRVMDFDDVVVRDRALLEKKVAAIRRAGPEKLQVWRFSLSVPLPLQ